MHNKFRLSIYAKAKVYQHRSRSLGYIAALSLACGYNNEPIDEPTDVEGCHALPCDTAVAPAR